ncbi:uncharacterized protein LOC141906304 [Tubulanus polymorphus]|uniref:uncharacterized protein LOC141906304 n=1 Tax=Tubulanus polymorphus TaxID=672921 RepID=UPI003DA4912E
MAKILKSSNYQALVRKRTAQRAQSTKIINVADEITNSQTCQPPDIKKLQRSSCQLQDKIRELEIINESMLEMIDNDEMYMKVSEEAEDVISKVKDRFRQLLATNTSNAHSNVDRDQSPLQQQGDSMLNSVKSHQPTADVSLSIDTAKTAIAPVLNPEYPQLRPLANIIFDDGSQRSFISHDLSQQLNLRPLRQEELNISGFGSTNSGHQILSVVNLHIVSHSPGDGTFTIQILIGADNYYKIVDGHCIKDVDSNSLTAVKTKLGYVLSGPVEYPNPSSQYISMISLVENHSEQNLNEFWKIECLGIDDKIAILESETDFMQRYSETIIQQNNGRYIAPFPWKIEHESLPTNYDICMTRTRKTARRLGKDPDMLRLYSKIIHEQESLKIIERIPLHETVRYEGKCHYIPHHPVFKDSPTTPIRIVYDCSCHENSDSPSFNDCLEPDPALQNDISSILLRFRLFEYAAICDLEKAFLQISLGNDKDFTRFLWLSDPSYPESPFVEYRFCVVLFGATSSPFILNATIIKHLLQYDSTVSRSMLSNVYVDNFGVSVPSSDELDNYYLESRELMNDAKFNLRSWASNCESTHELAVSDGVSDNSTTVKFLGLKWNVL